MNNNDLSFNDIDIIGFHSSPNSFNQFNLDFIGSETDMGMYGKGFYFTDTIEAAKSFNKKGYLYTCKITMKNPFIIKTQKDLNKFNNAVFDKDFKAAAKEMGEEENLKNNILETHNKKLITYFYEKIDKFMKENNYDGVYQYSSNEGSFIKNTKFDSKQFVIYKSKDIEILKIEKY